MTYAFNEYEERRRFDAFCKVVLRHEAIDYFRELSRQRKREIQFNTLSQYEMDKLCTLDDYPSDSFVFIFGTNWWPGPLPPCQSRNRRF